MRMDGSLSQTDRKQETINMYVNYFFIFCKNITIYNLNVNY